jgi:enoyl-CoA hydratase/carnithine racemase
MKKEFETVILEKEDHIAVLTLNRPERQNAFNTTLLREIGEAAVDVRYDDDIRVMIVTGAGVGFCSGADIKEYEPELIEIGAKGPHAIPRRIHEAQFPVRAIYDLEKPSIAMVNGNAIGSGMNLAAVCDIRTGSEKTKFMSGFARLGLVHGMGALWTLPRIVGVPKALELCYVNDFIDGEEASKIGLLNHLWPSSELKKRTFELAGKIAAQAPLANKMNRHTLLEGLNMDFDAALKYVAIVQSITGPSKDHLEAYNAFLENRQGNFKGE